MIPGPTLNVILGPNGSGKSSVVNGLALALGAKTNVLGRAENVIDFIRTGCDSAELEVELKVCMSMYQFHFLVFTCGPPYENFFLKNQFSFY